VPVRDGDNLELEPVHMEDIHEKHTKDSLEQGQEPGKQADIQSYTGNPKI
jgi:hypothetical protein